MRRRRVSGRADDEDRWRPARLKRGRFAHRLDGPRVAEDLPVGEGLTERRGHLLKALGRSRHRLRVRVDRVVQAVDRVEHLEQVAAVGAVLLPAGVDVGEREQTGAVPGQGLTEGLVEDRPALRVVERRDEAVEGQRRGQRPLRVPGAQRLLLRVLEHLTDLIEALVQVTPQRAVRAAAAVLGVGPQRPLHALRLPDADVGERLRGVQRPVEDHPPHAARVQVRVGGAEQGPVGLAEVVQALLVERRAQDVEVPGCADRVDVTQELTGVRRTGPPELLGVRAHRRQPLRRRRVHLGGQERVQLGVVEAVDGLGGTHATRVEADEVVGVPQVTGGDEVPVVADVLHTAGVAPVRTAEPDRALAVDEQLDLCPGPCDLQVVGRGPETVHLDRLLGVQPRGPDDPGPRAGLGSTYGLFQRDPNGGR